MNEAITLKERIEDRVNSGILGHPGARAMAKMIASVRRCDRLAC